MQNFSWKQKVIIHRLVDSGGDSKWMPARSTEDFPSNIHYTCCNHELRQCSHEKPTEEHTQSILWCTRTKCKLKCSHLSWLRKWQRRHFIGHVGLATTTTTTTMTKTSTGNATGLLLRWLAVRACCYVIRVRLDEMSLWNEMFEENHPSSNIIARKGTRKRTAVIVVIKARFAHFGPHTRTQSWVETNSQMHSNITITTVELPRPSFRAGMVLHASPDVDGDSISTPSRNVHVPKMYVYMEHLMFANHFGAGLCETHQLMCVLSVNKSAADDDVSII